MIFFYVGGFSVLFDDIMVSISVVELVEVMKKFSSSVVVSIVISFVYGSIFSMWNSICLVFLLQVVSRLVLLVSWMWSVVLFSVVNYMKFSSVGIVSMLVMNLWIVWLCDMCVMKVFMNGVQLIYQVQQKMVQFVIQVLCVNGVMCRFIVGRLLRYCFSVLVNVLKMKLVGLNIRNVSSRLSVNIMLRLDNYLML